MKSQQNTIIELVSRPDLDQVCEVDVRLKRLVKGKRRRNNSAQGGEEGNGAPSTLSASSHQTHKHEVGYLTTVLIT